MTRVRPLRDADAPAVRAIFEDTVLLGKPLPFSLALFDDYASVCLDWYLGTGRDDAAVAVDECDEVVGYALVCTDGAAYDRWNRRSVLSFCACGARALLRGELDHDALAFYSRRILDAGTIWRDRRLRTTPMHAHLNVVRSRRSGRVARALRDHIDDTVRRASGDAWMAEMNAWRGSRSIALTWLGMDVVGKTRSRTFSHVAGRPVERLLVRRVVPA